MTTPETNKELLRRIFDAWSQGDSRPLISAMSEDFRWVFPGSWSWSGVWEPKSAVVDGLLRGHLAPQLAGRYSSHPRLFLADDDRVVVLTQGSATTARGEAYDNVYCLVFRVDGEQLTEVVEYCDTSLVERVLDPPAPDAPGWTRATG